MTIEKAKTFQALHVRGKPLVLFNIWDAGTAKAVTEAGASALATGSWSVAAAHGYGDGEKIPLDFLVALAERIAQASDLPLSIDFEGGYSAEPELAAANVARILAAGAVGINFEDQILGGSGLHPADAQAARIRAIRAMADRHGMPFFINARTDLFLKEPDRARHPALLADAIARGKAYAAAGASGFFVPAAADDDLIAEICASVPLPVNVMMMGGVPPIPRLAELGVARVSFGPGPYRQAMAALTDAARDAFAAAAKH